MAFSVKEESPFSLSNEPSLAAGSAHHHSVSSLRLTLVKVSCLMVTCEMCHKGKISKCTWNFSPSLAADSFHSILELPAAKMNSAALLPCRVPLPNQTLPTTVPSCTMSELETRTWGSVGAGQLMLLSWGGSCSEQLWLLSPLPLSDQSKALHPHLSLLPRQLCRLGIPPIPRSQSWITQMQMLHKNCLFSRTLTNVGISPFPSSLLNFHFIFNLHTPSSLVLAHLPHYKWFIKLNSNHVSLSTYICLTRLTAQSLF